MSGVGSINPGTGEYNAGSSEGTAIVRVTDTYLRTQDASVIVNPPALVLSPSSITIQAGGSVTFTSEGGTPSYAYSLVSGVGSINGFSGVYTSAVAGSAVVKVTDSHSRTDTASVTVEPPPPPPLNLSPVTVNVQTGSDQTFTASGGSGGYTWTATAGSINSSGVYTAPGAVPSSPTNYTVRVTSGSDFREATVRVYAPLVISTNPVTVDAGTIFDFDVMGGIKPYTFSLPTDLGEIAALDADTARYTAPGLAGYETVRVTDVQGKFADWSFYVIDPATGTQEQP